MSNLSTFNDFMTATDQTVLSGADQLVNEAVKRSYFFRYVMKGRPDTEVIQGGKSIVDYIMFDEQSTYTQVSPAQVYNWVNPQVLDNWEIPWRFGLDHMSWTDQEIELQVPAGVSSKARARIYKSIKSVKERRLMTSLINGLEEEIFATPNAAQMEAATGKAPYSLTSMINEEANGLADSGWTTKQGLSPTAETAWAPQRVGYDYGTALTVGDPNASLTLAFDDMYYSHRFDTLPGNEGMSEATTNATMILASKLGNTYYKQVLRNGNDTWVSGSRQDPHYGSPMYADIPLVYASELDTAAVVNDAGVYRTESSTAGTNVDGPRYYWINRRYWKPVFHSSRYMYKHPVRTHPNQPSTHVQVVDCWHNYVVNSLQRHGIVYPTA